MSVELGTLEWMLIALAMCPWAVAVALILCSRSTGQFGEQKSALRRELDSQRLALQASHEREIATLQSNVDALKTLIRVQAENETLRKREIA